MTPRLTEEERTEVMRRASLLAAARVRQYISYQQKVPTEKVSKTRRRVASAAAALADYLRSL